MENKRLLFLYNPKAGSGSLKEQLSSILETLSPDYEIVIYPTKAKNDGKEKIMRARDFDVLAVAGGDGMLHEAINGLMERRDRKPLIYLPSGTVNDFASTHGIDKSLEQAIKSLKKEPEFIDIGKFNDEYFSYVACFGLLSDVSWKTSQDLKNRLGVIAYYLESLRQVDLVHWENNSQFVKVEYDGGSFEGEILFGAITNSRYIAGLDFFEPVKGRWADGLLEGLFIRQPKNMFEVEKIARALSEKNYSGEYFHFIQSPFFKVSSKTPIEWDLDGEYGGSLMEAGIEACSGAFSVYLPEHGENV